jgi:beta-lactamase regulating signal transducer with metallopeptidase domain
MPDSSAYFAGTLASYFLRVAVAYVVCFLLSHLSPSPRRRFVIWLFFLLGAAGYWVATLAPIAVDIPVATPMGRLPVHGATLALHPLLIPPSWAPAAVFMAPIVSVAYVLGVLLLFGNILWQHFGLRRALRHAVEPSRELGLLFEQMCRGFGVRRCQLLILPQLSSPATAGWLRPRILLPEICEEFGDSAQLADVLYHELVHVVRRDYLWATVSDMVRCLLFFHPAVWRARQHMRVQRELACDVAVVSQRPEHRADYAQSLTKFARLRILQPGRSMGIDFAASASILGVRVRAVLSHRPQRSWWRTGLGAALNLALVASFGWSWPALGIAAEFAPLAAKIAAPAPPLVVHPRPNRRPRSRIKRQIAAPPQLKEQPAQVLILSPAADQTNAPPPVAMSASEFGPQSNDLDQAEESAPRESNNPTWSETLPLPRSRMSAANVVQRLATGLAQIGRQQIGREGHDRNGNW